MPRLRRSLATAILLAVPLSVAAVAPTLIVLTFVNALWLRPSPIVNPENVVAVLRPVQSQDGSRFSSLAIRDFRAFPVFVGVAGQLVQRDSAADLSIHLQLAPSAIVLETTGVTDGFFTVLDLPLQGRDFNATDNIPTAPLVGIISDDLWRRRFDANPAILGSFIDTGPEPFQVIGIAPPGFRGALRGEHSDVWIPAATIPRLALRLPAAAGPMPMIAIARIRSGLSIERANSEFANSYSALGRRPDGIELTSINRLFGSSQSPLVIVSDDGTIRLVSIVGVLLLVSGTITLVAVLVVRYESRSSEFNTRISLGATRGSLVAAVASELLILVVLCAGASLAVSRIAIGLLPQLSLPGGIDLNRLDLSMDWRTVLTAIGLASVVFLAAGAWSVARIMQGIGHVRPAPAGLSLRSRSLHRWVLGAQVALTVSLLIVMTICIRAVQVAFDEGPGFDYGRVLFLSVTTRSFRGWHAEAVYEQAKRDAAAVVEMVQLLRSLPGVRAVALGGPPIGKNVGSSLSRPSLVSTTGTTVEIPVAPHTVSPEYFEALGVPFVVGGNSTQEELVVSESMAAMLWPDQSPVGQWLRWGQVQGTVGGAVNIGFGSIRFGRPAVLFRLDAWRGLESVLASRARVDIVLNTAAAVASRDAILAVARRSFPAALSTTIVSGRELVGIDTGRERLTAWFLIGVGSAAWCIGVGSVFGLVSYLVASRRREFAIMIAIGASQAIVRRTALKAGLTPAVVGCVIAVGIGLFTEHVVASLVVGLSGSRWIHYVVPASLFIASASCAAIAGAWRLRRLEPATILRAQ